MEITGDVHLDYPQEDVWNALMDPEFVAKVIPGCDSLTPKDEPDTFASDLRIKIGPIQGKFKADVVRHGVEPMDRFVLDVSAKGPTGFMGGSGRIELAPDGAGTVLRYTCTVNVGGRIARVGQRLVSTATKTVINRSLDGFRDELDAALRARVGTE